MKVKAFTDLFPSIPRRLLYLFYLVIIPYILAKVGDRIYQWFRNKCVETEPGNTFWSRFKYEAGQTILTDAVDNWGILSDDFSLF